MSLALAPAEVAARAPAGSLRSPEKQIPITKGVIVKERIIENGCRLKDEQLLCTAGTMGTGDTSSVKWRHGHRFGSFCVYT